MRIGLDLDNTLVCYDRVFAAESIKLGIMPSSWRGSKQNLRDELQSRPGGERLWQTLQGQVYGPGIEQATMYPGVAPFLMRSLQRGDELFIVSHKTEFGHFDPTRTPLRQAALSWMESRGFFEKSRFGLIRENIFFEGTRSEKVARISNLNLDCFVDDLEEVFAEEGFPSINKVLFNAKAEGRHHDFQYKSWSEIGQQLLGPMRDSDCKMLAQTFCPEQIEIVTQLRGHGNSRIYRILTNSGVVYALKSYPDLCIDPRPRLRNEVRACKLLEHLRLTPRSVSYDEELNFALFEWIDGEVPCTIETSYINQALSFVKKLEELSDGISNDVPEASEACLSGIQLLSQVRGRIQRFESIDDVVLQEFIENTIKPLWAEIHDWFLSKWPVNSLDDELAQSKQMLSPSDFGFHNSLLRTDGSLRFIDLEYFGRDDPVKLISDFVWHPAMNLKVSHKIEWIEGMFTIFNQDAELPARFCAAWPLYGLRWALIMLNEFHIDGWQKRLHAMPELGHSRKEIQQQQLYKAAEVCRHICEEKLECPYV